jgi:hydroxylamine reductase
MFCRQCEQTAAGTGCSKQAGVCGKTDETAVLQDLLIHSLKGIAIYGKAARDAGIKDASADRFMMEGLFSTITNVDFDPERLKKLLLESYKIKEKITAALDKTDKEKKVKMLSEKKNTAELWKPADSLSGLVEQGRKVGINSPEGISEDVRSLREIILYGLKGMAAYADHAAVLGRTDDEVSGFFYEALSAITDDSLSVDELVGLVLKVGEVNLKCMEMLDSAHTSRFGHPVPTKVSLGAKKGPAILVSGHDLFDLEVLLEETKNSGINIYTHGEMLPAHGYPELKKYKNLAGHFGGAWQDQQKEFPSFPGAILFTTNCIQKPLDTYKDRVFTTGLVAWPDVAHIPAGPGGKKDFSPVIKKALASGGYKEDVEGKEITVGFAHNAVLGVADKVVDLVKTGKIKRFFLIGGCDGAKSGRNYYTEFAEKVPKDCVIITLACGKFRFNKLEFGDIEGIPRLLDCGQCNDAYSAIKIASALADVFKCSVNDLPLSMILSWYEQKAVCILLTLFSLGIKGIKLGPSLPAFVSPNVLNVLVEKFNISPISTAEEDLKAALGV